MSRYIDADKLIRKYIDTDIKKFSNSDVKIVLENLKQNILKAPSIDIEPKRGEWIEISKEVISIPIKRSETDKREPTYKTKLRCSVCGFQKSFIDGHTAQYNYCPNCGADMRKETIDYEHVVLTCDDEGNWSMQGE